MNDTNEFGSYLGKSGLTSDQGTVDFNLADGAYKIRVDYLGYQFWTEVFTVPDTLSAVLTIPHQEVNITAQGDYAGDIVLRQGLKVYLFTPAGAYLGQYQVSDDQGEVSFILPERDYKVRVDYLGQQYWSEVFMWENQTISINEGMAEVHMLQGETPLEAVNVYVFTSSGTYLGVHGRTDEKGIINFRLPQGAYKFRGDCLGTQYWATEQVTAHETKVINLNTGGGLFTLTVEKEAGMPLIGVRVYVFNSNGAYLGLSGQTDDQGQVSFDLSDGEYQFRADYLGTRFWSDMTTVPTTLFEVITIPHQDVTISVESLYESSSEPIAGIKVYLFSESGSYLGQYASTDSQGQITFNLPQESYKVRADYLGYQFWSTPFTWEGTSVTINHGLAVLHATQGGEDVTNVRVYLFKASGSYMGKYEVTDANGMAQFLLPDQQYKFRLDYDGTQYWSDTITIIPLEENAIELNLDLLALDLTRDPNPVRFDGNPPELDPPGILLASIGSLTGLLAQSLTAETPSEKVYYYINDHLGTPQKIMDENAAVVWAADYKPFGEAHITVNDITNNFRFPGQYFDEETGLHYNWQRYYDIRKGRYLRADPIGLRGGMNLYSYVLEDPINIFDPKGLAGIGGGAYFVGGAEASLSSSSCCDINTLYNVKILTICGGAGIGLSGTLPVGITAGDISNRSGCPRTRCYFKHEIAFLYRSVNVQADTHGPSAGIDIGIYGISTAWAFCSDTVISKKRIGCCDE